MKSDSNLKSVHTKQSPSTADLNQKHYLVSVAASIENLPEFTHDLLPQGRYASVSSLKAAINKVCSLLSKISPHQGELIVERMQAVQMILSLAHVKAPQPDLLDQEHSIAALLKHEHKGLIVAVADAKRILADVVKRDLGYEKLVQSINDTRHPEMTRTALQVIGPRAPTIQTSVGPIHLSVQSELPKEIHCKSELNAEGHVVGGFHEINGTVIVRVQTVSQAGLSLLQPGHDYRVQIVDPRHRPQILLSQLMKCQVHFSFRAEKVPFLEAHRHGLQLILTKMDVMQPDVKVTLRDLTDQLNLNI